MPSPLTLSFLLVGGSSKCLTAALLPSSFMWFFYIEFETYSAGNSRVFTTHSVIFNKLTITACCWTTSVENSEALFLSLSRNESHAQYFCSFEHGNLMISCDECLIDAPLDHKMQDNFTQYFRGKTVCFVVWKMWYLCFVVAVQCTSERV